MFSVFGSRAWVSECPTYYFHCFLLHAGVLRLALSVSEGTLSLRRHPRADARGYPATSEPGYRLRLAAAMRGKLGISKSQVKALYEIWKRVVNFLRICGEAVVLRTPLL